MAGNVAWQPFATASVFREFADDVTTTQRTNLDDPCALLDPIAACNQFNPVTGGLGGVETAATTTTSRVGTYGQFGLGLAGQIIDTGWSGYARADYRTGENIEGISGNVGLRYQFTPGQAAGGGLKDGPCQACR